MHVERHELDQIVTLVPSLVRDLTTKYSDVWLPEHDEAAHVAELQVKSGDPLTDEQVVDAERTRVQRGLAKA